MVHASPDSPTRRRQANGFLVTISALLALLGFAKQANRLSAKSKSSKLVSDVEPARIELRSPKSPLARPKKMLSNLSNKTLPFLHNNNNHNNNKKKKKQYVEVAAAAEEWGHGGVWQKAILMGDKCQPLDFSGVIYYDSNGKQLNEIPLRSPRASPLPGYLARPWEQRL